MRIVLSLPGGGIRGLLTASYLRHVEARLEVPLSDRVDMIAGTSTGGILAVGLGLGVPAVELVRLYRERGPDIFRAPRVWQLRTLKGLTGPRYPGEGLMRELERVAGGETLADCRTDVMLTAHELETGELIDGGVHALDPTDCALAEALTRWPGEPIYLVTVGSRPRGRDRAVFAKSWRDEWRGRSAAGLAYATAAAPTYFPPGDGEGVSDGEAAGWGLTTWGRRFPELALGAGADVVEYRTRRTIQLVPHSRYIHLRPRTDSGGGMDDVSTAHLRRLESLGVDMAELWHEETSQWIAVMQMRGEREGAA